MAIYKPNNFYPYFQEVDMTNLNGNVFSCQANTNDGFVKGARLRIGTPLNDEILYENYYDFSSKPIRNGETIDMVASPYQVQEFNESLNVDKITVDLSFISLNPDKTYENIKGYCPFNLYEVKKNCYFFSLMFVKYDEENKVKQIQTTEITEVNINEISFEEINMPISESEKIIVYITLKNGIDYTWECRVYQDKFDDPSIHDHEYQGSFIGDGYITGSTKSILWFDGNQDSCKENLDLIKEKQWVEISASGKNSDLFLDQRQLGKTTSGIIQEISISDKKYNTTYSCIIPDEMGDRYIELSGYVKNITDITTFNYDNSTITIETGKSVEENNKQGIEYKAGDFVIRLEEEGVVKIKIPAEPDVAGKSLTITYNAYELSNIKLESSCVDIKDVEDLYIQIVPANGVENKTDLKINENVGVIYKIEQHINNTQTCILADKKPEAIDIQKGYKYEIIYKKRNQITYMDKFLGNDQNICKLELKDEYPVNLKDQTEISIYHSDYKNTKNSFFGVVDSDINVDNIYVRFPGYVGKDINGNLINDNKTYYDTITSDNTIAKAQITGHFYNDTIGAANNPIDKYGKSVSETQFNESPEMVVVKTFRYVGYGWGSYDYIDLGESYSSIKSVFIQHDNNKGSYNLPLMPDSFEHWSDKWYGLYYSPEPAGTHGKKNPIYIRYRRSGTITITYTKEQSTYCKLFKVSSYDYETGEFVIAGGLERDILNTDQYEIWQKNVIEGVSDSYDITEVKNTYDRIYPPAEEYSGAKYVGGDKVFEASVAIMNSYRDDCITEYTETKYTPDGSEQNIYVKNDIKNLEKVFIISDTGVYNDITGGVKCDSTDPKKITILSSVSCSGEVVVQYIPLNTYKKIFMQPNVQFITDPYTSPYMILDKYNSNRINFDYKYDTDDLKYYQNRDITINKLDNSQWLFTTNEDIPNILPGDTYNLYKNTADSITKSLFFARTIPTIDIKYGEYYSVKNRIEDSSFNYDELSNFRNKYPSVYDNKLGDISKIFCRDIYFMGEFISDVAVKRYRYKLYDSDMTLLFDSGNIYDNTLLWGVQGLIKNVTYYLTLEIENNNSNIINHQVIFITSFKEVYKNNATEKIVLSSTLACSQNAVKNELLFDTVIGAEVVRYPYDCIDVETGNIIPAESPITDMKIRRYANYLDLMESFYNIEGVKTYEVEINETGNVTVDLPDEAYSIIDVSLLYGVTKEYDGTVLHIQDYQYYSTTYNNETNTTVELVIPHSGNLKVVYMTTEIVEFLTKPNKIHLYKKTEGNRINWVYSFDDEEDRVYIDNESYKYGILDYNVSNNMDYTYLISIPDERITEPREEIEKYDYQNMQYFMIENNITTSFDDWSLIPINNDDNQDLYVVSDDIWKFLYNLESEDLTINNHITLSETKGRFPKMGYDKSNYLSSGLSCLLGDVTAYSYLDGNILRQKDGYIENWGENIIIDGVKTTNYNNLKINNILKFNKWKELCNSKSTMLLRDLKGNVWAVGINEKPSVSNNDQSKEQIYTISFKWNEIDDLSNKSVVGKLIGYEKVQDIVGEYIKNALSEYWEYDYNSQERLIEYKKYLFNESKPYQETYFPQSVVISGTTINTILSKTAAHDNPFYNLLGTEVIFNTSGDIVFGDIDGGLSVQDGDLSSMFKNNTNIIFKNQNSIVDPVFVISDGITTCKEMFYGFKYNSDQNKVLLIKMNALNSIDVTNMFGANPEIKICVEIGQTGYQSEGSLLNFAELYEQYGDKSNISFNSPYSIINDINNKNTLIGIAWRGDVDHTSHNIYITGYSSNLFQKAGIYVPNQIIYNDSKYEVHLSDSFVLF